MSFRLFQNKQVTLFLLVALCDCILGHSWIACSDYTEKNGADWNSNKCRGFPRGASRFAQKNTFGQDTGYDHRPSLSTSPCNTQYGQIPYSNAYPKAIYYPGQQVVIAHPMKNHGADAACTNIYIPDNGNAIYRGRKGTDTDKPYSYYKQFLVADLGTSPVGASNTASSTYPKPGYQNAPHFCKNTDKSMGTYSFNIPQNLEPGDYTFVWRWSFNGKGDLYSTCFDVTVAANKAARDNILRGRGMPLDVACGGKTSNNGIGSKVGCDGSNTPPPTTMTTTTTKRTTTRPTGTTNKPTTSGTSRRMTVNAFQIVGVIELDTPINNVKRRYVSVHFDCPVVASFWNARLILSHNHENRKKRHAAMHYDLLQEQTQHLASRKIYYTATFDSPCDIVANPPIATLTSEE